MMSLEQDILSRVRCYKDYRFTEQDTSDRSLVHVQVFQMMDVTDITQEELGILLNAIKEGRVNI